MSQKASLLLVDDHAVFRQGLATILQNEPDLQVIAEASDGQIAIEMVREYRPDLVLMDISMPNLDGVAATRQIIAEFPGTKIVALSVHSGKRFVRDMLQAGAAGYILKESAPEEMIDGIRTVLAGDVYLSAAVSGVVLSDYTELLSDAEQPSEAMLEPILHTKLHRPPVSADIISRVRLLEVLEEGRQRTMTLISAPAGYGKSVLASQWLEASQSHSAWLSLDEEDNDLRRFVRYLLETIRQVFPALSLQTASLLQAVSLAPIKVLTRYLLNDLEQLDETLVLVLDDYHRISQTSIHELLQELLQHPTPRLHLVLLTRRDPPLPVSQIRARGQLTEITMEDLRFSATETRLFLERVMHVSVSDDTASLLEERMEGWVTGLRLAALSIGRERGLERLVKNLAEHPYYVQKYLLEEVLSHVPPLFARYLMETSLLDRFCAPLCDVFRSLQDTRNKVEEDLSGQAFIEWLETTHLFVIPLDETHEWFRYHHLFQQLLQHQLEQRRSVEEIERLHLLACEWFAEQGLLDEAIRHALAGEDVERAVLLVEEHRQTILNTDREYLLEKWLALLPDKVKMERPALLLAQAWVYRYQFKLPAILPLLDRVESLFEREAADEPLQGEVDFFRGYCGVFMGDSARSLDYLTQAVERVPFHYHMLRGETEIILGLAAQMEGRLAEAMQTLEDVLEHQHALTSIRKTRVLAAPVFLKIIAAEFDDAAQMYLQRLYDAAVEGHHDYAKAWSFCLQGLIASARYEPDAAIHYFRQAVELRYVLHARAAVDSLAGLSFAYQLTQQPEQADATLALLFEFVRPFSEPAFLALAQSCQARLAVMQGKLASALRWLKSTPVPAAEVMFWWLEIPALTSCRVLLAEGSEASLREAEQRLQDIVRMTQDHHNVYRQIDSLALSALVSAGQNRLDDALANLEDALVLAEPGGVIGPFIEPGPPMADLLNLQCQRGAGTGFIEQILNAFNIATRSASEPSSPSDEDESIERSSRQTARSEPLAERASSAGEQAWIVESLTDREIEVLELLNQRLYNKEIAEEMAIALETVKSHLKSIYQKLNVKGRRQAVAKARELGLLSS